jgi:hypothetical protein
MFEGWTAAEVGEYQGRAAALATAAGLRDGGATEPEQAAAAGISVATLWRWRQLEQMARESGNARMLLPGKSGGRPPLAEPTARDVMLLKAEFVKTNRARGQGSKTLAARRLAKAGRLSEETTAAILKPRASKHSIPKRIKDAMRVAPDVIGYHRAPKALRLGGLYAPGTLRMARGEDGSMRRLLGGERQSWDDASINFCVCVPWPWGGDKCSDRFGVRVGRFQLLAGIDDASDYCPGWSFVMREAESYNRRDVVAAMCRTWRDDVLPAEVVLEGGSWQADQTLSFVERAGVRWIDAKGRPHQKLIEGYWNRAWSVLSTEDGQIGRYRGEMERENKLLMDCKGGRLDPRAVFPELSPAMNAIDAAVGYLNGEPVESRLYGRWIPAERYAEDLKRSERLPLDPGLAWLAAPVQEVRLVRRSCVAVQAMCPLGVSFPYHFAAAELNEFIGQRVRVHFDPWDSPITATITLEEPFRGISAGTVITTRAQCLDSAPEILEEAGRRVEFDQGAVTKMLGIRKAVSTAIRTEYRSLGLGGRRGRLSEVKGPDGSRLKAEAGVLSGEDGLAVSLTGDVGDVHYETRETRERTRMPVSVEDVERMGFEADELERRMVADGVLVGI